MRKRALMLLVIVSAVGVTLAQTFEEEMRDLRDEHRALEVQSASSMDEDGLARAIQAWDEAHDADDVDALVALYAEGEISMPSHRPAVTGRAALERDFRAFFDDFDAEHHATIRVLMVGGWTIEHGNYTLSMTPREGGETHRKQGKHVMVRERIDGEWRTVWEIWKTDSPPE